MKLFDKIGTAVMNKMGNTGLVLKAHSPEILLGLGIASMTGAVVTAALAGRKQDDVWDSHLTRVEEAKAKEVETVKTDEEGNEFTEVVVRSDAEIKSAVRKEYLKTVKEEVKCWGPTVGLMGGSIACFVGMHNIQAGEIAGLSTALNGLREYQRQYEQRNIELNGVENHNMCKYGYKDVVETDEDGFTEVKKEVKDTSDWSGDDNPCPDYFHIINEDNSGLSGFATQDILMLQGAERQLKRLVEIRGWAVGNDLFDMLKMPRTQAGMVMGWIKGGKEPKIGWDSPANNPGLAGYDHQDWQLELNYDGDINKFLRMRDKAEIRLKERAHELAEAELKKGA